ncbi:hypothetical protein QTP70_012668 [Hemibagrus guttatus]|uniref:Uncharacterized protein n=1 Tax=Hemibagrus guttatus TaxID=175788 RepID=A0AAE0QES3_9TELE|nr:hypothetical protein QTP70_012668 [Hemibagrus guttatus]
MAVVVNPGLDRSGQDRRGRDGPVGFLIIAPRLREEETLFCDTLCHDAFNINKSSQSPSPLRPGTPGGALHTRPGREKRSSALDKSDPVMFTSSQSVTMPEEMTVVIFFLGFLGRKPFLKEKAREEQRKGFLID